MNFLSFPKEKLLPILANRTAVFFFVMCLLTLFLYIAGTVQEFTDSTQLSLLKVYPVLRIFLTVASVCGMVLALSRSIKTRKARYVLRAGGYLLLIVFAVATVFTVMAIVAISGGDKIG